MNKIEKHIIKMRIKIDDDYYKAIKKIAKSQGTTARKLIIEKAGGIPLSIVEGRF